MQSLMKVPSTYLIAAIILDLAQVAGFSQTPPPSGSVVAWGYNEYGQTTVPTGLGRVTAIAAGAWHTVAVKADGTVAAWGRNNTSQLNIPLGLTGVKSVAGGEGHTLALKTDGTVVGWGRNLENQRTIPAGLNGVVSIAAGGRHSVALKSDGTVVAWGLNGNGQATVPAGLSGVMAISAGGSFTMALKNDGTVVDWGLNSGGVPSGLSNVVAIAAGGTHRVALKSDGTVVAWLGDGSGQATVPTGLVNVIAIAAGNSHTLALKSDGSIAAWGANGNGQTTVPSTLNPALRIAASFNHSVALEPLLLPLEAPSEDLGLTQDGFDDPSAFDEIVVDHYTRLRLVDLVDDTASAAPESVYVDSLVLPSTSILDLNGLNLYARLAQLAGTVVNGTVNQIANTETLTVNTPTVGQITEAGELDEWVFTGSSGSYITVALETAGAGLAEPPLGRASIRLLDPSGNVIATTSSNDADETLLLRNVYLPVSGDYKIRVHAAASNTDSTGSYRVATYERDQSLSLVLNQQHNGRFEIPYRVDRWTFTGAAGQQLRLDPVNSSGPGVAYTLRGPGDWVGFDKIAAQSDLISLPFTGTYTLVAMETGDSSDLNYAFRLVETQQISLTPNVPYTGEFVGNAQARLFRLVIPSGGPLELHLANAGDGNRAELYASRGAAPTRTSFEHAASSGPGANRSIYIPSTATGSVWYIMVYADQIPAPGDYTLEARLPGVTVTGLSLSRQASNAIADFTITGAGFVPGTIVELLSPTSGAVVATATVSLDSYSQVSATFAANVATPGTYDLRVTLPGGATTTLPGSFTYLPAGNPELETKLIMPKALGRNAVATIYVEYANVGNTSMPAPLLILKSADPDGSDRPILTLDSTRLVQSFWGWTGALPPRTSHEALILASGAQPGVLNPGERRTVPVYFLGLLQPWDLSDANIEMEIRYWTADDPTPIDWASRKEILRPSTLDAATWNVVFENLTSALATNADYLAMLNDNARYLSRLGLRVVDVDDLWNFEVQQAYGYSALPVLEFVTDAEVDVPGIPLTLSRRFSSNLRSRNARGLFGQGWFSTWETRLVVERSGNLVKVIGEGGSVARFSKDSRKAAYFSDAGVTNELVLVGAVYELRSPNGNITRFRADGRVDYMEDSNGNRVTASWNGSGQLTALAHNSGASISLSYGGNGTVSQVVESTGRSVTFTYDGLYLVSTTTDDGKTTTYTYDTAGPAATRHALASINRAGTTRRFSWDARGRLASTWVADGEETATFAYDSAGRVSITQGGGTTAIHFEHRGLVAKVVDPLGHVTSSEFDKDLRLKRLVLPTGESQSFTWCTCGSPTSITDELGHTTRFRYDHPLKKMTSFVDAKGNPTRYAYDAKGNNLATTYADESVESRGSYTSTGLPQVSTNRRGQAIHYTYTSSGKIARKALPDGSYDDFAYDTRGNLVSVTEHPASGPARVTTYTYETATHGDRIRRIDYPESKWVEYDYDPFGRRVRLADSAGGDTRYEYDEAGRLSILRDASNTVLIEYLYDDAGRLSRINKGNGTWTTYTYDAAGQILSLVNNAPNGTPNSRFDYTYDARGRRVTMDTLDGAWTYAYDPTGQLTHAVFDSTNPEIEGQDLRYYFDAHGNRTSTELNDEATAYVSNALNQYSAVDGVAQQYDIDGNLISDGERNYAYDVESHLIQVTGPEGVTQYEYDAFGNRIATVHNGGRTEYLLDPTGMVDVLAESKGASAIQYTRGQGIALRFFTEQSSNYYDHDVLGSTAGISSTDGSYSATYRYSPTGTQIGTAPTSENPFQFVGGLGIMADASGLVFMRARFFNPNSGRFLTIDPSRLRSGDSNFYRYAFNDPVHWVDPLGLWNWSTANKGAAIGAIIGGIRGGVLGGAVGIFGGPPGILAGIGIGMVKGAAGGAISGGLAGGIFGDPVSNALEMNKLKKENESLRLENEAPKNDNLPLEENPSSGPGTPENPSGEEPSTPGDSDDSGSAGAIDPNEKIGPGLGPEGWVRPDSLLPYRINFENIGPGSRDPNGDPYPVVATAPAQRVTITDELEDSLDWNTFEITDFGWGDTLVSVPAGTSHYTGTIPVNYNGESFVVEVEAGIDFTSGQVRVVFQSIDPETSLPPGVLTGFLPPEDGEGAGKGHISYTIRTKAALPTGTEIRNIALIQFDLNEVIATNQINPLDATDGFDPDKEALVTLDGDAPVSSIGAMPTTSRSPSFNVAWGGSDLGIGIDRYDIYVSTNGGPWELWIGGTTDTSALFQGQRGNQYGFRSVARDQLGNVQTESINAQATVEVEAHFKPLLAISGKKLIRVRGSSSRYLVRGTASDQNDDLLVVEVQDSRPKGRKTFRPAKGIASWTYTALLRSGRNTIEARAVDAAGNRSIGQRITVIRK